MKKCLKWVLPVFVFVLGFVPAALVFAAEAVIEAPPSIGDVVQQGAAVLGQWSTAGTLASVLALVNVLINATKLSVFDGLFAERAWLRPLVATVFGMIIAFLQALIGGSAVPPALLVGLIGGLSSVGFHELMATFNTKERARRIVAKKLVVAAKIVDEKQRLQALADIANGA